MSHQIIPEIVSEGITPHVGATWTVHKVLASAQDQQEQTPADPLTTETEDLLDVEGLLELADLIRRIKDGRRLNREDEGKQ